MQYSTTHALVITKGTITVEKFNAGGEKVPGNPIKALSAAKLENLK